jgi:VanZ family protein
MRHVEMNKRSDPVNSNAKNSTLRRRLWRYVPLIVWIAVIFISSSALLRGNNTSRIIRPLLLWLFPDITEENLLLTHFAVRKAAHFTEYAILALLAVRAFAGSSREWLRRNWFTFSLLLVILLSLTDEFHQSFVPSRVGTIYDSMIDMAGGLTALVLCALWRRQKAKA